ncbi:helix-turn-helix domain-containing protein [Brevundimonas sp. C43]
MLLHKCGAHLGFRRSRRIEMALAEAVGTTPDRLWPARYRLQKEGDLIVT